MLTFTSPLLLAALAALPVVWWLLRATPPPPRRTPFGGTMFLEGLADRAETPARTPWWLLVLRLAAITALIIGLAGPVMNARSDSAADGPVLLVVDDSWAAAPRWRARQELVESLALDPQYDGRPVRLLTTAGEPTLSEPVTMSDAYRALEGLVPKAALPDRNAALELLDAEFSWGETETIWISDGVFGRTGADRQFLERFAQSARAVVIRLPGQETLAIRELDASANRLSAAIDRIGGGTVQGLLDVFGTDGRLLTEVPFEVAAGEASADVAIDLPLTLRNEVARLAIRGVRSAGATWLTDGSVRRVRVGLVSEAAETLLNGGYYIERALEPVALVTRGAVTDLIEAEAGVIVLDDIGVLRPEEEVALLGWVESGGILVRFAGPNTANSTTATGPIRASSFPVPLRGGERSFGGALTWEDPQPVAPFAIDSPFSGLAPEREIPVRRQVLSRPVGDPNVETWASLMDGTPLVTALPQGDGYLILFHVTATPTWSDLPLSGVFPAMLARVTRLAARAEPAPEATPLAPYRLLDGFGGLTDPNAQAQFFVPGVAPPAPGLYGDEQSPVAINTYPAAGPGLDALVASRLPGNVVVRGLDDPGTAAWGPYLIALALALFALDALVLTLRRWRETGPAVAACLLAVMVPALPVDARAQVDPPRPRLDPKAVEATRQVQLAYVITGDREADRLSRAGLAGLTREAIRRSALEPGEPAGLDLERDDLSVYPLIYWPIVPGVPRPSNEALAQLERFMADGGLLIIDTRDGERPDLGNESPAGRALKDILVRMNIPPLEPLPAGHILTKSFYYLEELHGRNSGGAVWVEASSALRETTDGVPSLIISGRDWAAAWAVDEAGIPLRPVGPGGPARREYAYRAGINMAMVALTGSYKEDQVHVRALLDRLGETP
jgi:hypothetical protein